MRNYLYEMLDALTSAYSRKDYNNRHNELPLETSIGKLFAILSWGLGSVQEQAELIKLWDDLNNARGSVLDRYGANFGVKRVSQNDRNYRLAIKVKVMAQLSGGDINTVIWAVSSFLEIAPTDVLLEEVYPAKIVLYVDQKLLSPERIEMIFEFTAAIKRIIAAGIGIRLYLRTYRTYRFDLPVKHFVYINGYLSGQPATPSRINRTPVKLSCGTLGATTLHAKRQMGSMRVYYSTRIKSKRID